jgi:hypothetical protein
MILFLGGCKDFGVPDFELKIVFEEGVIGTPTAGTYSHKELTEIEYSYEALDSQYTAEVIVNGSRWLAEGSLIMYTDLEILVRIIDIRGEWTFTIEEDDEEDLEFVVTFNGNDLLSGEFTDDRGYRGTWSLDGAFLTMTYDNWLGYELYGYIDTMEGTWERGGYTGSWSAEKVEE